MKRETENRLFRLCMVVLVVIFVLIAWQVASAQTYNPYLKFYANDGKVLIGRVNYFSMETTDYNKARGWMKPYASFIKGKPWQISPPAGAWCALYPDWLTWLTDYAQQSNPANPFQHWMPQLLDESYTKFPYVKLTLPAESALVGVVFHAQVFRNPLNPYIAFDYSCAPVTFVIGIN